MEDIVFFLGLRLFKTNNSNMFSGSRNEQVTSVEKSLETTLTVPLKCKITEETKKETNVKCFMNY